MDLRGKYADDSLSTLELAALDWLDGFYQLEHLLDARAWTIRLTDGAASPELKFAALVHDAERFFRVVRRIRPRTASITRTISLPIRYVRRTSLITGSTPGLQWLIKHFENGCGQLSCVTNLAEIQKKT
jgi:hypothetical protein